MQVTIFKIKNIKYLSIGTNVLKVALLLLIVFNLSRVYSQIAFVGGVLNSDKTLASDTTYVVIQDLTVPDGIKLTIDPGTTIRINFGRGIIIDNGVLDAVGNETDSISFVANHSSSGQIWKWRGVELRNIDSENEIHISFARIENAETAILVEESLNVIIQNSSMSNCQNIGINLLNTSYCFIVNCLIENNYNGIELFAGHQGNTSNNLILNTQLKNENHNIYVYREDGGLYQDNIIRNNIISGGNNGIWIDNNGGSVNSKNVISKNVIMNNGSGVGYGLFLANDSTIVTNNIFWQNNIAIFSEEKGDNCSILNNSFYQNQYAITIGGGSQGNKIFNNTFSLNINESMGIKEVDGTYFSDNNLLNNYNRSNIFVNNTSSDINVFDNYWGTLSSIKIDSLIYDHNDNPGLGTVYYQPFLQNIDTANPVSPPYNVIKQLVGNKVRVSWKNNQESDLNSYSLYFGSFNNYSFNQSIDVGRDTSLIIQEDVSIYDEIAVTALDNLYQSSASQLEGHESPYAFAQIYPYAGSDTVICEYEISFPLTTSNVPYVYDELLWHTSGDGVFNNAIVQNPIYYPGENDIESGSVMLRLEVVANNDTLSDKFQITILNDPFAIAGSDTVIFADSSIKLINAEAFNYDFVTWETGGDGIFSDPDVINTIYTPGINDNQLGYVYLSFTAHSECGTSTDSLKISITPYFTIEGKVKSFDKDFNDAVVIAINADITNNRNVLISEVQPNGEFLIKKVLLGNYYIYAVPDTSNLQSTVPSYYANRYRWNDSYLLPVFANVYDIDIEMQYADFNLPIGDGSISGHMILPTSFDTQDNIYCTSWFTEEVKNICDGGLSNNTVLLFNSDHSKLLDYTLTDEFGNFYFSELPYGSYIVDAEKAGYNSLYSSVITLNPENSHITDVTIELENLKIIIVSNELSNNMVTAYPNPVSDKLFVENTTGSKGSAHIMIYNTFGSLLIDQVIYGTSGSFNIDVNDLKTGIYYGIVISDTKKQKFRFIVN